MEYITDVSVERRYVSKQRHAAARTLTTPTNNQALEVLHLLPAISHRAATEAIRWQALSDSGSSMQGHESGREGWHTDSSIILQDYPSGSSCESNART